MRVSVVANNLNQSVNIIIDKKIRLEEVVEKTFFDRKKTLTIP